LVVGHGCGLVMTKLNVVSPLGSRLVWFWPMTHFVDCPANFPWSSRRKHTARADSTFVAKSFFNFSCTTAFWPTTFGGETVTASWAWIVFEHSRSNVNNLTIGFIQLTVLIRGTFSCRHRDCLELIHCKRQVVQFTECFGIGFRLKTQFQRFWTGFADANSP